MKIKNTIAILALAMSVVSCDDFFDVNPDDKLLGEEYPSTVTELYSGIMGVAAKVQDVADHAMYIEGLRSDFLEPTANATDEIIDIYNYNDISESEFASPVKYYEVILNANDYIAHAEKFYLEKPTSIEIDMLHGLVGSAIRYKCWAYMMLVKLYGEAVWLDDPLIEYKDLSEYPVSDMNAITDKCIDLILTGVKIGDLQIDGKGIIRWADVLNVTSSGSERLEWNRYTPPTEALLSELYLMKNDYKSAITWGLAFIATGAEDSDTNGSYTVNKALWNGSWITFFNAFQRHENAFMLPYDYDKQQTNRLVEYFANDPICKYYMRPTQLSMDRFNIQSRDDGSIGDTYRGNGKTFKLENGEWIVSKFINSKLTSDQIFRNDPIITPIRAATVHFFIIEALIMDGRFQEAAALFEDGMASYYNSETGKFNEPFEDFPSILYSTANVGANVGIRGRVSLLKVASNIVRNPVGYDEEGKAIYNDEQKREFTELYLNEVCLESAGEAQSMFAMIRAAERFNDPSIVADRISAKYPDGKKEEIRQKLMDKSNWYINYNLRK